MPNANYTKGRRKEYKVKEQLLREGALWAQRTAGSHSPIDVIGIFDKKKIIKLVQCKPDNFSEREKIKLFKKLSYLSGIWMMKFELR